MARDPGVCEWCDGVSERRIVCKGCYAKLCSCCTKWHSCGGLLEWALRAFDEAEVLRRAQNQKDEPDDA